MTSPLVHLPHEPPMRLVEEVVEIDPGERAICRRLTRLDDWFFQGHFPGNPVVPAIVLVELVAQTGGLAVGTGRTRDPQPLRVAAFGPFKFPAAAGPGALLEATAQRIGAMGGLFKVEGRVTADGVLVAEGSVTLAATR
jgi:3-hydroxyacyl-[acyl-carrier-protein] dehydratase